MDISLSIKLNTVVLVYFNLILTIGTCFFLGLVDFIKLLQLHRDPFHNYIIVVVAFYTIDGNTTSYSVTIVYGLTDILMTILALLGLHKNRYTSVLIYTCYTIICTFILLVCRTIYFGYIIWPLEVLSCAIYFAFKILYILSLVFQVKSMQKELKLNENDRMNCDEEN